MRWFRIHVFALLLTVPGARADEQPKASPEKPVEPPEDTVIPGKVKLVLNPGGHIGRIVRVLFTPNGKQLVTAGEDNTIHIWDVQTGQSLRALRTPGRLWAIALSPDGQRLAASFTHPDGKTRTNAIALIALADGHIQRLLKGPTANARVLAFSADGRRLAAGVSDKSIQIWDLNKDEPEKIIKTDLVTTSLAFSPDGASLVEGHAHDTGVNVNQGEAEITAVIRDIASDKVVPLKGAKALLWWGETIVAWSPDGKTIATGSTDGLWLWEPDGKLLRHVLAKSWAVSVAFSADSKFVLATGWSQPAKAWIFNVRTGREETH